MRKQEVCSRSGRKEHRPNLKESNDSRNWKKGELGRGRDMGAELNLRMGWEDWLRGLRSFRFLPWIGGK